MICRNRGAVGWVSVLSQTSPLQKAFRGHHPIHRSGSIPPASQSRRAATARRTAGGRLQRDAPKVMVGDEIEFMAAFG
jgi:hypothetical protein